MSRPIFSDEAFAEWLEKQPRKGTYNYMNPRRTCECLVAQYLSAKGMSGVFVGTTRWWIGDREDAENAKQNRLPDGWDYVARGPCPFGRRGDWTYGKALDRLRAHMAKESQA